MVARYINTDIAFCSEFKPSTVDWLKVGLDLIFEQEVDTAWKATRETAEQFDTPSETIKRAIHAVSELSGGELQIWNSCWNRKIDIGFECEDGEFDASWQLEPELVKQISHLGLALVITIYRSKGEM